MRKRIFKIAVFLLALTGFFAGVIVLGQWARDWIRDRDRYRMAFVDIDVDPPPGLTRSAFLEQVQYGAMLPDSLSLVDDGLADRLAKAFHTHPWVAKVADVKVTQQRQIKVRLIYRKPVLAVQHDNVLRAVDGEGVLLPKDAATAGLPMFAGTPSRPAGPAGTRWGDAAVETRARALSK
jgi:hypothetical protein